MTNRFRPAQDNNGGIGDKIRLLAAALVVIVAGLSLFLYADEHHTDPSWVFLTLGSISLVAIVDGRYPAVFHSIRGRFFLGSWAVIHGVLTAIMIARSLRLSFWLPIFAVEFFIGFTIMRRLESPRR